MCNQFALHHQFGIDTWRSKFEQQTDSVHSACGSHRQHHKDPDTIDLNAPRHAQHLHKAWKRHQSGRSVLGRHQSCFEERLKFCQTRSNAMILHETLPAYCIPKVVRMETGEVIYEKVYASHRPPLKISLKHDWMKDLGSEVAQRPDGQVVQQSKSSQSTQPNPNPDHDRTVKPVVCRDAGHAQSHEQSMLSEVHIDFRISGLPYSVLKQAENSRVRELVKKIGNHPHRQSLQRDLQQNKAYNPFGTTSKKMIQDVRNVELFELFETDPKTQCKECRPYWSEGIVYCTCGHLLKEIAANRGVIEYTLDLLSIPDYIIKKGRPHGHRYGKTPEKKEYHQVHNLEKRCIKKNFKRIHNRFLRDPDFHKAMLEHDRDEEVLYQMGRSCRPRFLSLHDGISIFSLQTKLVGLSQ